jgi:hypothetical protein
LIGLGVLKKGAEKILSVFDKIAGFSFLRELSEMLSLFSDLLGGFRQRAQAVYELLRRDFVGFPPGDESRLRFRAGRPVLPPKIDNAKLPFLGFVVNRVHPEGTWSAAGLPADFPAALRAKAVERLKNYEQLAKRDQKAIAC